MTPEEQAVAEALAGSFRMDDEEQAKVGEDHAKWGEKLASHYEDDQP